MAILELKMTGCGRKILVISAMLVVVVMVGVNHPLQPTPYKALEQYKRISGTRIVDELSSPLGLLQVLESPDIPLHYAPGMSLVSQQEPLEQKGVFTNGEGLSVITRAPGDLRQLGYLDQMTSALAYHLRKPEKVLILGIGGGQDILQAKYHGSGNITGVELNPQMVQLLQDKYADYSG